MSKEKKPYSEWGILMPFGNSKPYEPPTYPEPKYSKGQKYKQWKYFDWEDKPIEGNYEVDCEITGKSYYNITLGWIYNAIASEPVQLGDNYWNKFMSTTTYISEKELDKQFKKDETAKIKTNEPDNDSEV